MKECLRINKKKTTTQEKNDRGERAITEHSKSQGIYRANKNHTEIQVNNELSHYT